MKLAFVCGSLEPGRDGVGDYTRRLALACARRGHAVRLLAVSDPWAEASARPALDEGLSVLRLTSAAWRGDEGRAARAWLDEFSPDWVSLQFVPYSFHPRGFFGGCLPALLNTLEAAPRRQIFFHEIWIGSHCGASAIERITGWWQRATTRRLLQRVRPAVVQTSTTYYREALVRLGAPAEVLPLFGNVPVIPCPPNEKSPRDTLTCGLFGTLHPGWDARSFFDDFVLLAAKLQRRAVFVSAGSLGVGEADFDRLALAWAGRITFQKKGRQSASALSALFARWDFAVTCMPWITLGKSGTIAALREHGLRVVATAPGSHPRFGQVEAVEAENDAGCVPYFRDHALLASALKKTPPRPGLDATAARFLASLATHA